MSRRTETTSWILWVDPGAGLSGDRWLAALVDLGVPLEVLQQAVEAVFPQAKLSAMRAVRGTLVATKVALRVDDEGIDAPRFTELDAKLRESALTDAVCQLAHKVLIRLAAAEARVHGQPLADVALTCVDEIALAQIIAVAAGMDYLGADEVVVGPISVGGGFVRAHDGFLQPVPTLTVLELLRNARAVAKAGPSESLELADAVGVALAAECATRFSGLPTVVVEAVGCGAGPSNPHSHANVMRLVFGRSDALESEFATDDELSDATAG